MKKCFLFSALLAAMMLTGCSESVDVGKQPEPAENGGLAVPGETPVTFSAYQERSVTRGGLVGNLDLDAIKQASDDGGGFGVFAYYTDLKKYDQTYIPNFMYNQKVEYNDATSAWEYSPVLYWPNEYGSDAQSDDEDKVSFFAYAPYVKAASPAAGSVDNAEWGITGFSRNTTAGDPIVKYIASFDPAKSVDLCWGVVGSSEASWGKIEGSTTQSMTVGLPWLNVEHPKAIDQRLKFTFKHALSQLNVQIDADPDLSAHNEEAELATGTKVYVRSISFTGIALQGALNLNNTVSNMATWLDYSGSTDLPYGQSVTVKDGRRDGREGTSGAEANNETPKGLNSAIIQNSTETSGVTHELQNLFQPQTVIPASDDAHYADSLAKALAEPVYVIPTGETMSVTIVYDIETASDNLSSYLSDGANHGVSVENRITKTVEFNGGGLESGKRYTLKLHLGMNSVKFDADVSAWASGASSDAWLPSNTGDGEYNINNPLSITKLNGAAPDPAMAGATATKMTITGLLDGGGDPNYADISANSASEWTMDKTGIIQIASDDGAGTRGMVAMTRSDSYTWYNSLTNTTKVKIKPLKAGTVKLTATDHSGNASSCVITVDAPQILLDQSAITLYKFTSDSQTGTVTATMKASDGGVAAIGTLDAVSVTTKTYQEFKEATGTDLNTAVTLSEADGASNTYNEKVVTASLNTETGEITLTPQGAGTATVTVTSTSGATATISVTTRIPTFNINTSAMTLVVGDSKALTFSGANPAEDETYTIAVANSDDTKATYDAAKGKVTAVAEGTANITFNYTGYAGDHDPVKTCVVTVVATSPTAMKTGDGVMATNPLWKVAQYNVDIPQAFEATGKPSETATNYRFKTYHSTTAQYVFTYACAKDTIDAIACADGGGGALAKYHVPTYDEQVTVIPSNKGTSANAAGTNIFSLGTSDPFFEFPQNSVGVSGDVSPSGTGYFYRNAANDFYAVRIISGAVTAWHYKYGDYNGVRGLKIDSYVLDKDAGDIADLAAAKVILAALPDASEWNGTANESPATAEDADNTSDATSLVSRFLPACGYKNIASPAVSAYADTTIGSGGLYWSVSRGTSSRAFYWNFDNGLMREHFNSQSYGLSVRPFRD
ncbi:MAG: fimbrillin family protein [Prevotella sp.]|nr:fimbrillin family protein [Prevotella sp.]MBQ3752312.1 fimbrillin family protein [Prevotella sp.]